MMLPACDQCYNEVYPLVLTGIGYSIYAAAIWGSVPYTVPPQTVGSAFGICTAVQNIGLVIAPTVVGIIKDNTTRGYHYYWVCFLFVCINVVGFVLNLWLYIIDIKKYGGILNNVDTSDQLNNLMTSP